MGSLSKRRQHYGQGGSLKETNMCIVLSGLSMSTVEEESDTVTVETVNSVTLTQDTEGNLILHCPQNGIDFYCTVLFLFFIDHSMILACLQIRQAIGILFIVLRLILFQFKDGWSVIWSISPKILWLHAWQDYSCSHLFHWKCVLRTEHTQISVGLRVLLCSRELIQEG